VGAPQRSNPNDGNGNPAQKTDPATLGHEKPGDSRDAEGG
jgi:hypothetical protein